MPPGKWGEAKRLAGVIVRQMQRPSRVLVRSGLARTGLAILLGCLAAVAGCRVYDRGIILEITQPEIQQRVAKKFPISRSYPAGLKLTLSDPEVALEEGSDRIGFSVSATTSIKVNRESLGGRIMLRGGLRYKREDGALVLVKPEVNEVAIPQLPEEYKAAVVAATNLAVGHYLDGYTVYKLDRKDLKQRLAKLFLQEVVVRNGVLVVKLGVSG
jgi:Protein of unknown function (DUF1439)